MCSKIVWAKMKHFSTWPATLCSPPEHIKKPKNVQSLQCVYFFGTLN